jgi:hypothetical protein
MLKYHVCSRKSLFRGMGGIVQEGKISKKVAEVALEHTPKTEIEGLSLLRYKLYARGTVSTRAIKREVW